MTDPDPITEKAEYERFDEDMLEQCPGCGTSLDPRWHTGPVYEPTGVDSAREYEHLMETDPGDGPFWCPDCWNQHYQEVQAETHRTLSEFVPSNDVYYGE